MKFQQTEEKCGKCVIEFCSYTRHMNKPYTDYGYEKNNAFQLGWFWLKKCVYDTEDCGGCEFKLICKVYCEKITKRCE